MYRPGREAPKPYDGLVSEVARRVFRDSDQHMLVRVRFTRGHSTLPGVPSEPEDPDAHLHQRVRNRRDVQ